MVYKFYSSPPAKMAVPSKSRAVALLWGMALTLLRSTAAYNSPRVGTLAEQLKGAMNPNNAKSRSKASFAEMGVFLEPKMIPDHDGNMVVSFLHTSNISMDAGFDSAKMPVMDHMYPIAGQVAGLVTGNPVTVILGTMYGARFDILMERRATAESPGFLFEVPRGRYYIKIEASGYHLPGVSRITRPCKTNPCLYMTPDSRIAVYRIKDVSGVYRYNWELQGTAPYGVESLSMLPENEASVINANRPGIETLMDYSDAAAKLKLFFGIELHGTWGSEYASRLYGILDKWDWYKQEHRREQKLQKWVLTDEPLYPQDVAIIRLNKNHNQPINGSDDANKYTQVVTLSKMAFTYAVKRAIEKGKGNGTYFSRRLHKALIRALCLHDPDNMRILFHTMHDVQLVEPSQIGVFHSYGLSVSRYPANHYQSWFQHPEELVELATSWREFPAGLQKIKGLKYLYRRKDGMVNPETPTAAAIAYPRGPNVESYIEFMESAFASYPDVPGLVLHELSHFVHSNVVSPDMFAQWRDIGGWYRDPHDPDGWSTRLQTQFVSAYGHKKNPSEDFATCLSDYVLNPNLLRSRAPRKYDFMRNHVMNGAYYVTKASHEFLVLNLGNPDFMYPGRITGVSVTVTGKTDEDKHVKFVIHLANNGPNSCAKSAEFRLVSSVQTFVDVVLHNRECSHVLETEIVINRTQKRGVWTTDQIILVDDHRLHRYVGSADFGMRVWIDNSAEDFLEPRAITPSISLNLLNNTEGTIARATWIVADAGVLNSKECAYASVYSTTSNQYSLGSYAYGLDTTTPPHPGWRSGIWQGCRQVPSRMCDISFVKSNEIEGTVNFNKYAFDEESDFHGLSFHEAMANVYGCFQVAVNIPLKKAARSGNYYLSRISTFDSAGNSQMLQWPKEEGPFVTYNSGRNDEDNYKPELRNIRVESKPTNPEHPNGETVVHINFEVRDIHSGIAGIVGLIRDPFGSGYYFSPDFKAENNWQTVTFNYVLPKGSVPGVWHLSYLSIYDNAGNNLNATLHEQVMVQG